MSALTFHLESNIPPEGVAIGTQINGVLRYDSGSDPSGALHLYLSLPAPWWQNGQVSLVAAPGLVGDVRGPLGEEGMFQVALVNLEFTAGTIDLLALSATVAGSPGLGHPISATLIDGVTRAGLPLAPTQATAVVPTEVSPFEVTTSTLPTGHRHLAYHALLRANRPELSWFSQNQSLPPGLTLDASGRLHGTPTTEGDYQISVTATSGQESITAPVHLTIAEQPLQILTAQLPPATPGVPYEVELDSIGGKSPITWVATGLPDGLLEEDGHIRGTIPNTWPIPASGSVPLILRAADSSEETHYVTRELNLLVLAALPAETLQVDNLAHMAVGRDLLVTPYRLEISGSVFKPPEDEATKDAINEAKDEILVAILDGMGFGPELPPVGADPDGPMPPGPTDHPGAGFRWGPSVIIPDPSGGGDVPGGRLGVNKGLLALMGLYGELDDMSRTGSIIRVTGTVEIDGDPVAEITVGDLTRFNNLSLRKSSNRLVRAAHERAQMWDSFLTQKGRSRDLRRVDKRRRDIDPQLRSWFDDAFRQMIQSPLDYKSKITTGSSPTPDANFRQKTKSRSIQPAGAQGQLETIFLKLKRWVLQFFNLGRKPDTRLEPIFLELNRLARYKMEVRGSATYEIDPRYEGIFDLHDLLVGKGVLEEEEAGVKEAEVLVTPGAHELAVCWTGSATLSGSVLGATDLASTVTFNVIVEAVNRQDWPRLRGRLSTSYTGRYSSGYQAEQVKFPSSAVDVLAIKEDGSAWLRPGRSATAFADLQPFPLVLPGPPQSLKVFELDPYGRSSVVATAGDSVFMALNDGIDGFRPREVDTGKSLTMAGSARWPSQWGFIVAGTEWGIIWFPLDRGIFGGEGDPQWQFHSTAPLVSGDRVAALQTLPAIRPLESKLPKEQKKVDLGGANTLLDIIERYRDSEVHQRTAPVSPLTPIVVAHRVGGELVRLPINNSVLGDPVPVDNDLKPRPTFQPVGFQLLIEGDDVPNKLLLVGRQNGEIQIWERPNLVLLHKHQLTLLRHPQVLCGAPASIDGVFLASPQEKRVILLELGPVPLDVRESLLRITQGENLVDHAAGLAALADLGSGEIHIYL